MYIDLGLSNAEILAFLTLAHRIVISMSTLKRTLRRLKLRRRKDYSDLLDVAMFITKEHQTSGQLYGYRWMYLKCIQNNLRVPRDIVYEIMKMLDPEGIEAGKRHRLRRCQYKSKGPNFVWHIDSYDKLKPYGIAINGCIDSFSRHIVWL